MQTVENALLPEDDGPSRADVAMEANGSPNVPNRQPRKKGILALVRPVMERRCGDRSSSLLESKKSVALLTAPKMSRGRMGSPFASPFCHCSGNWIRSVTQHWPPPCFQIVGRSSTNQLDATLKSNWVCCYVRLHIRTAGFCPSPFSLERCWSV